MMCDSDAMPSSFATRELADELLQTKTGVTLKQWLFRSRGMSDRKREDAFEEATGVRVGRTTLRRWMNHHNTIRVLP